MQIKEFIYKEIGSEKLEMKVFLPDDSNGKLLPAVIFFGGGGWVGLRLAQFEPFCEELVKHDMIGITLRYRVRYPENDYVAMDSNDDSIDAADYIFEHAEELGIDRESICLGGGSAGGQIAAYIGYSRAKLHEINQPKALILFNPVIDLKCVPQRLIHLFEGTLDKLSPINHFCEGEPPTIIFQGDKDDLIDYKDVIEMGKRMELMGNIFEVHIYPGYDHGFFNYINKDKEPYYDTVTKILSFLKRLGFGN